MEKDHRFEVVQHFITEGRILTFKDIFKYFPPTLLAKELSTNNNRLKRLTTNPEELVYKEIKKIAAFFGVQTGAITKLIDTQLDMPALETALS